MDGELYETTPYGVMEIKGSFCVRQMWWGKTISTHKTRDEAQKACMEEARARGYLKRVRVRNR